VPTLNTSVYNQSSAYPNNPTASTPSPLTSLSMATTFTDASLKSNMSLYHGESKKLKNKGFDDAILDEGKENSGGCAW